MTRDELLDIIDNGEWVDVEFKRAANNLPADVWQTVSAFANTKGGTIGFGIEETDGGFNVHGVENPEKLQSDFLTTLRGEKFNIALSAAAERHEIDGKIVLIFHINEMPRQAKPIYYGNNIHNSFIRLGSGDQRCSQEEIQRMLREASEQSSDSMILEGYTEDDLEVDTIKKYRSYLSAYDPSSPLLSLQQNEFLQRIGAISIRRPGNTSGLTLAGLLLFGKIDSIQSVLQQYENQYYYVSSNEWGTEDRWDDRVICQENLIDT
ncbi:AlbA family DNA-binding domain-containing protein [Desulfitibacter alkalitolerans]|uniref:AlbA family DNA-binding domain-containing protein n=1 Tax=Desulfitibacter alkalitolerans TaxID=264641 RepID=UPI000482D746|nr:RNA-binding domain-containing protein [Desulfitibacter alkalitolerans]